MCGLAPFPPNVTFIALHMHAVIKQLSLRFCYKLNPHMLMFNHNTNQTIWIYKYDEVFCSFIMHVLYYLENQTLHNYYDYITVPL